jgi:hypothetical protein
MIGRRDGVGFVQLGDEYTFISRPHPTALRGQKATFTGRLVERTHFYTIDGKKTEGTYWILHLD